MRRGLILIICSSPLLSGCGQSMILPKPTGQTVSNFVYQRTGFRPQNISCPSGIPAKVGGRFECHFSGPDGQYTAYLVINSVHGQRVVYAIQTRRTG